MVVFHVLDLLVLRPFVKKKINSRVHAPPSARGAKFSSVAEPPLFWAAPASGGQGPGAYSGSDLLGSAPAPG